MHQSPSWGGGHSTVHEQLSTSVRTPDWVRVSGESVWLIARVVQIERLNLLAVNPMTIYHCYRGSGKKKCSVSLVLEQFCISFLPWSFPALWSFIYKVRCHVIYHKLGLTSFSPCPGCSIWAKYCERLETAAFSASSLHIHLVFHHRCNLYSLLFFWQFHSFHCKKSPDESFYARREIFW